MEVGIGRKIREGRERVGLTQEDLAERMEVSRQAVSKWEADLSRPSSENLLRLCRLLGLDWEDLAAETEITPAAPVQEAVLPEEPLDCSPPKRRWVLPLVLVLAAFLTLSLVSLPLVFNMMKGKQDNQSQLPGAGSGNADNSLDIVSTEQWVAPFPDVLELTAKETRSFGNTRNGGENVPAADVEEGLIAQCWFPNSDLAVCFYQRQEWSNNEPYYVLFAVYSEDPQWNEDFTVITSIAEGKDIPMPDFQEFHALGYSGCKATTYDEFGAFTFYFALDENSVPMLLFTVDGETFEMDIDADGENEIISPQSQYILYDRGMDDFWAFEPVVPDGFSLDFTFIQEEDGSVPDTPAFCLKSEGEEWKSYRHLRGDVLVPGEVPCSRDALTCLLCPDVTDTVFTFTYTGEMYDSDTDPDLPFQSPDYPTHRQLAYMAMQTLYELTGVKLERCYANATDYSVYLSVDRNSDFGTFFYFSRDSRWAEYEKSVGGFMLVWKNEYAEFSPIDPALCQIPGDSQEEQCLWLYQHARFFQFGEITDIGWDMETRLVLEDGSFFEVSMDSNGYSRLAGPYPQGFSH